MACIVLGTARRGDPFPAHRTMTMDDGPVRAVVSGADYMRTATPHSRFLVGIVVKFDFDGLAVTRNFNNLLKILGVP